MAILLAVLLLGLCAIGVLTRRYSIALFNAVWAFILFVCRKELRMDIYELTLALLTLMIIMVNVGYALSIHMQTKRSYRISVYQQNTECDYTLLTILLIISGVIFLYYAFQTVRIYGLDLITIRRTNNAAHSGSVFSSMLDTILFYGVATPLFYMVSLVFTYNFSQNKTVPFKLIGILFAVVLLQMVTTGGGRSAFIRIALFVLAAVLWKLFAGWKPNKKVLLSLLIGIVVLWCLMEIFTLIRNRGRVFFIEQVISYVRGSVGHMQYRLTRLDGPQYYAGYAAFGGFLYYPIKVLNVLTGWDIPTSSELFAYLQEQRTVQLYDQTMVYNALVPNAFYFFFDNGFAGVIVYSALEGFFLERAEKAYRKPTFLWFVGWATCVYMIAYSMLDGVLWTFRHPTTIIYCFIFHRLIYHVPGERSNPIKCVFDRIPILKGKKK